MVMVLKMHIEIEAHPTPKSMMSFIHLLPLFVQMLFSVFACKPFAGVGYHM